ncbi:hypothetical protein ACH474_05615 [Nocardia rhamnosiphila]|uniref:hypothetical protein n=1 Tax=Nocardia rhamnosiphila TaxID=426716 RepID=UPI00379DBB29
MRSHTWGRLLLGAAALLHLLPAVAVFSVERAAAAYGIAPGGADLRLLLRHRGLLLAILGVGLIVAVFRPRLRSAAIGANAVSMAGFVALLPAEGPVGPELLRVAAVDAGGLVLLAGAAALLLRNQRTEGRPVSRPATH